MTDVEKMKARREARMRKILQNAENRLGAINGLGSSRAKSADSLMQVSNTSSTERGFPEKTEEIKSSSFFLNEDPADAEEKILLHASESESARLTPEFKPFDGTSGADISPFCESILNKSLKIRTKPTVKLDGNIISLWIISLIVCIVHCVIKLEPDLFLIVDRLKLNMPFMYLLGFEFYLMHKGQLQKSNSLSRSAVLFSVLQNYSKNNYINLTLKIVKIFSAIMHDVFVYFFLYTLNSIVISRIKFLLKILLFSGNITNVL